MDGKLRILFLIFLASVTLFGCQQTGPDQHYARALGIERQLLRSSPDADYSHPGYIAVLRELKEVARTAKERDRAELLARRIMDGRRMALSEAYPQLGDLPHRLRGAEKPSPRGSSAGTPSGARSAAEARPRGRRGGVSSPARLEGLTEAQKAKLQVTMYSTSWCGYCKRARNWLQANGIPFTEKDVEKDPKGSAEFRKITGGRGGVPVITVGDEVIRGFSVPHLEKALRKAAGK